MNIKRIFAFAAAMLVGVSVLAQEGPVKPVRVGVSVTVGSNAYAGISALPGTLASYESAALPTNWMDKAPAFGIEGSLILADHWKLDLGGAFNFGYNPGYPGVEGTGTQMGDIPTYEPVILQQSVSYQVYLAGSYYFRIPMVPAVRPSVGLRFGATYANNQQRKDIEEWMGTSVGENYTLGASIIAGFDYYFSRNFFAGVGVDLFRYVYGVTAQRPQEGLGVLGADSHNFGFLGAPKIKVGFMF